MEDIKQLEDKLAEKWKKVKAIPGVSSLFSFRKYSEKIIEASDGKRTAVKKTFKVID